MYDTHAPLTTNLRNLPDAPHVTILVVVGCFGISIRPGSGKVCARFSQNLHSETVITLDLDLRSFLPQIFEVVEEVINLDGGDVAEKTTTQTNYDESLHSLLIATALEIWRGANNKIK